MTQHPARISAATLSALAIAALVIPSAAAAPATNAPATTAPAATSPALTCRSEQIEQRLNQAVERAKAEALLQRNALDEAEKNLKKQQGISDGLDAERQQILTRIVTILTNAHREALTTKQQADAEHAQAQMLLGQAEGALTALQARIQSLTEEITQLRQQKAANEAGTDALSTEAAAAAQALTNAQRTLTDKEQALTRATEEVALAEIGVQSAQRQLAAATTARDEANQNLEAARQTLTQAQATLAEKKASNATLKGRGGKAGIEHKIQEAQTAFDTASRELTELDGRIETANNEVTTATQDKEKAEADLKPVLEASQTSLTRISELEQEIATAQDVVANARQAATEARRRVAELTGQINAAEQAITGLEQEIQNLNTQKGVLDGEISALDADIRQLMGQPAPDQQQLEEKRTARAQKQTEWEGVTGQIQAKTAERDTKQGEFDTATQDKQVAEHEATRQTQLGDNETARPQTLGQSLTAERDRLAQEQPTLEDLRRAVEEKETLRTQAVATHADLVAQRPAKEQAKQDKQAALDAAKAIKDGYGADFAGNLDEQYQKAEDDAQRAVDEATRTAATQQAELTAKEEQVTHWTAAHTRATETRAEKAALKVTAAGEAEAARTAKDEATARNTRAQEARAAGHAQTAQDMVAAEVALAAEQLKVADATQAVATAKAALADKADKKAKADAAFEPLDKLAVGEGVTEPLADPRLAALEAQIAPIRRGLAQSDAGKTRLYTFQSLRNMARDAQQAAAQELARAEAELADAMKLERCPVPPKSQGQPGAPKADAPAAEKDAQKDARKGAQQSAQKGLAKTGATDLTGVALLSAMIGAGTLVTASRRRSAR
ncbi:hypothetical protein [Schaalia sp. Marseille-Q2122]|uniref:hypothetical protein n=1 Tax=Schaalia sp. Marseille-Q2122 TaxID=2736604 RepID=UPI00158ACF5F|nr:hypothetical protein [Schaalia sp. Marseille-Q2122]